MLKTENFLWKPEKQNKNIKKFTGIILKTLDASFNFEKFPEKSEKNKTNPENTN